MASWARSRKVWLGAGFALVAVVAVGAYVAATWFDDSSTPVAVGDVIDRFDDEDGSGEAPAGLPAPGVYVYATTGSERVDALGGTVHEYPPETTVTVAVGGCGVTLRWDALEERYDEWTLCPVAAGLEQPAYVGFHRFFGQPDTKRYVCEPAAVALPADPAPGDAWSAECAAGDHVETWSYEVLAREAVEVGGVAVDTAHVRARVTLAGGADGEAVVDDWIVPQSGLLVRRIREGETVSPSAVGPVRYEERYEIALTSLEPRR